MFDVYYYCPASIEQFFELVEQAKVNIRRDYGQAVN